MNKKEQHKSDVASIGKHVVRSEMGEDGIKVTQVVKVPDFDLLYGQATDRLIKGMLPGATDALKEKYPKALASTIQKLKDNPTAGGVRDFEDSMRRGFIKLGMYRGERIKRGCPR